MNLVAIEISQTLSLPFVDQAYLNEKGDRVVIELKVSPTSGIPRENVLFFRADTFSVGQVKNAIIRIRKELTKQG